MMTRLKNTRGKTRKVDDPYEVYVQGNWTWRVLKHYQRGDLEMKNAYARVYCAVSSPMTYGAWEYGDVYCGEIPGYDRYWGDHNDPELAPHALAYSDDDSDGPLDDYTVAMVREITEGDPTATQMILDRLEHGYM